MRVPDPELRPYLDVVDDVLPGFGFFGAVEESQLSLEIDALVDRLELAIAAPQPEFLNIQVVRFFGRDGSELQRAELCRDATLSSIYGEGNPQTVMDRFLAGGLLHSQKEARPTLRIRLNEPIQVSRVAIGNRADIYGQRSRYIEAAAFFGDEKVFEYRNDDASRRLAALSSVLGDLGLREAVTQHAVPPDALPAMVRGALLARIEAGCCGLSIRTLVQFLPFYARGSELEDFHIAVCAEILLKLLGDEPRTDTIRMKFLSEILDVDTKLDRLQIEASRLRTLRSGRKTQVVLSKHDVHEASLVTQEERYLDALDELFSILHDAGATAVLCYGSLLGAVREGKFLAHDDDVDVLFFDGSATREEAVERKHMLIDHLGALGYEIWGDAGENFHVQLQGVAIDLFFCWKQQDRLSLMMEKFKYRDIDAAIVLPPSTLALKGRIYPVPADPEAFLEERYGPGWKIPDPYHEWPWAVRSSTGSGYSGE